MTLPKKVNELYEDILKGVHKVAVDHMVALEEEGYIMKYNKSANTLMIWLEEVKTEE